MTCIYCAIGAHFQCMQPLEEMGDCCCAEESSEATLNLQSNSTNMDDGPDYAPDPTTGGLTQRERNTGTSKPERVSLVKRRKPGRPKLSGEQMVSVIKTGRKRAVLVKPIEKGVTKCEWSGLKFAGGGVEPIIGCRGNDARDVHHGPDKSVLNNDPRNLHAICTSCHARWHAKNDSYYSGIRPENGETYLPFIDFVAHDSETKATIEEVKENEAYWFRHKPAAAKD